MSSFLSSLFSKESHPLPQEKSGWLCPGASSNELPNPQSQSSKMMTPQQAISFHQPSRDFLPERTRNKISLKEINRNHTRTRGKQQQEEKGPINISKRNIPENHNLYRKNPQSIVYTPEIIHQPLELNKMHTEHNNLIYHKNLSKTFMQGFVDKNQYKYENQNVNTNTKVFQNSSNNIPSVNNTHFYHHIPHRHKIQTINSFQNISNKQLNPNLYETLPHKQKQQSHPTIHHIQQSHTNTNPNTNTNTNFPSIPSQNLNLNLHLQPSSSQRINFELSPSNIQDSSKQESTCFVYKSTKYTLSTTESHQNIIMIKDIKVIEEYQMGDCLNFNQQGDNFPEGFRKAQSLEGDGDQEEELSILIQDYYCQNGGVRTERKSQIENENQNGNENLSLGYNSVEGKDCQNIQNRRSLFYKL